MSSEKTKSFRDKHPGDKPDPVIKDKIISKAKDEKIPCAVTFEIATNLGKSPDQIGKTIDLLNYRLTKCQLGLFGYTPEKKIVKPIHDENQSLKTAILENTIDGRLPCKTAWDIAEKYQVQKMVVSGFCEALGIKIKPCQLGAF